MSKAYVIHEPEVHFDVEFNINGYIDESSHYRTKPKRGELYVSEGSIYIGRDDSWYRIGILDIKDILAVNEERKIELVFDEFSVSLFTNNYSHLNALRDILTIVQHKMQGLKVKKKKVKRGVAN